jgi:hypothetical protein
MNVHPIISQIVNRQHIGESDRAVIYAVVNGLQNKRAAFLAMSKATRRQLMEQALWQHAENRGIYREFIQRRG